MKSVILGANPRIVNFYSAYFDMLGVQNQPYNSVSVGLKRAAMDRDVVNILVILESRDDFLTYSRLQTNLDVTSKNLFIVCVDDALVQMASGHNIITFSHRMLTMEFADVLAGAGACQPYMKDTHKSSRSPEKIFEHIKFMLAKGNITLPVESECATRVLQSLDSDDVSFKAINDMTKIDPALHSGIIRMANSVYFSGSFGDVGDVQKALVRVGLSNVKAFLVNFINKSIASNKNLMFKDEIMQCVHESQITASLCYVMADFFKVCSKSQMFSVGMLSRLGEIFILAIISDYLAEEDREDVKAGGYTKIASKNNIMVGSTLMKKWKFSDDFFVPLLFSKTLKQNPYMNETRILYLAFNMFDFFKTGEIDDTLTSALKVSQIQLSEKQLIKIRTEAERQFKEFIAFM